MPEPRRFILELAKEALPPGQMTLHGVEVLRSGRFNDVPFPQEEIDLIGKNTIYLEQQHNFDPPFARGHYASDVQVQANDRETLGYWRKWFVDQEGVLRADLEILDEWTADSIRAGRMRYLSAEIPYHTSDPKTGNDIGPSVAVVASVDSPANRTSALFGEAINISEFPDLSERNDGMGILDKMKEKLGLKADTSDDELLEKVQAFANADDGEKGPEPVAGEAKLGATATAPVSGDLLGVLNDMKESVDARLDAADKRVEIAEKSAAESKAALGEQAAQTHRTGVADALADLRKRGRISPVVEQRLAPILSDVAFGNATVKLGEGDDDDDARDVRFVDELLATLGELPPIVSAEILVIQDKGVLQESEEKGGRMAAAGQSQPEAAAAATATE